MTNKEYIEKNNISFSDAMKMWNNKTNHIEDWLNQERIEPKFKVGDVIVFKDDAPFDNRDMMVFFVIDFDDNYIYVKECDRSGNLKNWSTPTNKDSKYHDNHFVKVIKYIDQDYFKKIF